LSPATLKAIRAFAIAFAVFLKLAIALRLIGGHDDNVEVTDEIRRIDKMVSKQPGHLLLKKPHQIRMTQVECASSLMISVLANEVSALNIIMT